MSEMQTKAPVITLSAIIQNVRTTVDGGWRISFDVPQSEVTKVMQLSSLRDMELGIAIVANGIALEE